MEIDLQSHTAVPAVEMQRLTRMEVISVVPRRRSKMWKLRVNVRNVLLLLDQSFHLDHVLFEIGQEANFYNLYCCQPLGGV